MADVCLCCCLDPSITQTVFGFFSCVGFEDDSFNQLYPSISCANDNRYQSLYGFFVVLAVVVVAFPPLVFIRLYLLNRNGSLIHNDDTRVVYGALTDMYRPDLYFWETLVLLRRMIVAAITLAPQFSNDAVKRFAYLVCYVCHALSLCTLGWVVLTVCLCGDVVM